MKVSVHLFLVFLFISFISFASHIAGTAPRKNQIQGTIIGTDDTMHSRNMEVVYKDTNGITQAREIDRCEIVTDGKTTIDPREYLFPCYKNSVCKTYGALPGYEAEYKQFSKKRGFHGWPETPYQEDFVDECPRD